MNKRVCAILCVIMFITTLLPNVNLRAEENKSNDIKNFIKNGSFERVNGLNEVTDWKIIANDNNVFSSEPQNAENPAKDGNRRATFRKTNHQMAELSQEISVPNGIYLFSFWIKAEDSHKAQVKLSEYGKETLIDCGGAIDKYEKKTATVEVITGKIKVSILVDVKNEETVIMDDFRMVSATVTEPELSLEHLKVYQEDTVKSSVDVFIPSKTSKATLQIEYIRDAKIIDIDYVSLLSGMQTIVHEFTDIAEIIESDQVIVNVIDSSNQSLCEPLSYIQPHVITEEEKASSSYHIFEFKVNSPIMKVNSGCLNVAQDTTIVPIMKDGVVWSPMDNFLSYLGGTVKYEGNVIYFEYKDVKLRAIQKMYGIKIDETTFTYPDGITRQDKYFPIIEIVKLFGIEYEWFDENQKLYVFPAMGEKVTDLSLVHYPVVEPQSEYPKGISVSHRYRVLVKALDDTTPWNQLSDSTAVYDIWPDYPDAATTVPEQYRNNHVHLAQVDTNKRVKVRVELLSDKITTLKINPSRYEEVRSTCTNGEQWIEFEVDPDHLTKSIMLEINAPEIGVYNNGLVICVNPISVMPEGNVLTLPSGVIDETSPYLDYLNALVIEEDSPYDALYIPADTLVDGHINVKKIGFVIAGRGMVTGSRWKWPVSKKDHLKNYPNEISPDGSVVKDLIKNPYGHTEGIVSLNPYHFNFNAYYSSNVKAFGFRMSSDGVHGWIRRGCFVRNNDDDTYCNKGLTQKCNFWTMQNGANFQLGWGQAAANTGGDTMVTQCNILRTQWRGDNANNATFSSRLNCNGDMSNVYFTDIRIDGTPTRLISYAMKNHKGALKNFLFKDIWVENTPSYASYDTPGLQLKNYLQVGGGIENMVFDHFVVGGKRYTSITDFGPIVLFNANDITFR